MSNKKNKKKFRNLFTSVKDLTNGVSAHVLTLLSMIPLLVAIWIAFPTFSFTYNNQIYEVTGYQPFEDRNDPSFERIGFKESGDLQGKMVFKVDIEKPEEDESQTEVEVESEVTSEVVSGPQESLEIDETQTVDLVEQTVDIIRQRLDALEPIQSEMYRLENEDSTELMISLSMSREDAGGIPLYITLDGDVSVWVDDPGYVPAEDGSDQFNPFAGRTITSITSADIASASAVNDQSTLGPGIRLAINDEAASKVDQAATTIGANFESGGPVGFLLAVDGTPVAIQSVPYTPSTANLTGGTNLYFSVTGGSLDDFKAIAAAINSGNLPLNVNVVPESNSNIAPEISTDLNIMKLTLFVMFVVANIILVVLFRSFSILNFILNANVLVISVALLKIFRQPFSIGIVLGVFLGLIIIMFIGIYTLKILISDMKNNTPVFVKNKRQEVTNRAVTLGFLMLMWTVLLTVFGTVFTYDVAWGFGVAMISMIITMFTVYRTFVNELFILPLKQNVR